MITICEDCHEKISSKSEIKHCRRHEILHGMSKRIKSLKNMFKRFKEFDDIKKVRFIPIIEELIFKIINDFESSNIGESDTL